MSRCQSTLLDERRDFTAIVAASDVMAIGVLRALNEHHLRVPDDISLASFDGIEFSEYTSPPLTTMQQDREAIGCGAVRLLIAMIEETEKKTPLFLLAACGSNATVSSSVVHIHAVCLQDASHFL